VSCKRFAVKVRQLIHHSCHAGRIICVKARLSLCCAMYIGIFERQREIAYICQIVALFGRIVRVCSTAKYKLI
jgi:hypothetical protein